MKFNRTAKVVALVALCLFVIQSAPPPAATAPADNPFFTESALPFHAPPFDKIKDTDYTPAIEAGMKAQLAEIEAIANSPPFSSADDLRSGSDSGRRQSFPSLKRRKAWSRILTSNL